MIFYYLFCSISTSSNDNNNNNNNYNFNLEFDLLKFSESLKNKEQINFIKNIIDNNLASIKSFDYNAFAELYGNDCKNYIFFIKIFR